MLDSPQLEDVVQSIEEVRIDFQSKFRVDEVIIAIQKEVAESPLSQNLRLVYQALQFSSELREDFVDLLTRQGEVVFQQTLHVFREVDYLIVRGLVFGEDND